MFTFINNHYRKTKFKTGGLIEGGFVEPLLSREALLAPNKHVYPRKLDFRDTCLRSDNQDNTPHCAGYSMAGYVEICNWRKKHYPEQFDGDSIYYESKKIDGFPDVDGTWIRFAAQAAINLGMVSGEIRYIGRNRDDIKCAIHSYWSCVASFMITDEWNIVNGYGLIKNLGDKAVSQGGHAVLICGYCDDGVYIQNSWGTKWGLHGFALLSWEQVDRQFMGGVVVV